MSDDLPRNTLAAWGDGTSVTLQPATTPHRGVRLAPPVPAGAVVDLRQPAAPTPGLVVVPDAPAAPAPAARRARAEDVDLADELGVDGLFRKKNSRFWHVRFKVDGKTFKRTTRKTDRAAAAAEAEKIRAREERRQAGLPDYDDAAGVKPDELLELYLKEMIRRNRRVPGGGASDEEPAHVTTSRKRIAVFFDGVKSVRDVTPEHVVEVLERLAAEPITRGMRRRKEKGEAFRSGTTLNGYLGALRAFFRFLVARKRWPEDPTASVPEFPEGDPTSEYRPMSPAERASLLASELPFERFAAYVVTAATALRRQELLRLRVDDLDLTPADGLAPSLRVRVAVAKNKRAGRLPLHPDAVAVLKGLVAGRGPADTVFDSLPTHETFTRDVRAAGLEPENGYGVLTMTSLRSGLATDLDRTAGATPEQRRKLMRHETAGLTDRVYTKYELEELAAKVERLELIPVARRQALGLGEVGHLPPAGTTPATEDAGVAPGPDATAASSFPSPDPRARVLPSQAVGNPCRGGGIGRRARFRC